MKPLAVLCMVTGALAQTSAAQDTELPGRMVQLMESTAVAVPGLVRASEALKQNAAATVATLEKAPQNPALIYLFMRQMGAYLALSDSFEHVSPYSAVATQQYAELREDLQRLRQRLEALLDAENLATQTRNADPSNLKRYAQANGSLPPPGKLPRVVFLGDASTELWRVNEYFSGRDFINRGIAGQTSAQMLGRFPDDVEALHPKAVVILAGTADLAFETAARAIENNLAMMGDLAKAHSIRPVFGSLLPVSAAQAANHPVQTIQEINRWLQDYCKREGFSYINYYSAMADSAGFMRADISDDGLNPNGKGYRIMSPIALEALGRVLSGADQTPPAEPPKRRFRMLGLSGGTREGF